MRRWSLEQLKHRRPLDVGDLSLLHYQRDQILIRDKHLTELRGYTVAQEMALLALGRVAIVEVMYFILTGGF